MMAKLWYHRVCSFQESPVFLANEFLIKENKKLSLLLTKIIDTQRNVFIYLFVCFCVT